MMKAFILSLDALAAIGLLFVLIGYLASISLSFSSPELRYQRLYYAGKDVINILEKAKYRSVSGYMPAGFGSDCNISGGDLDKTLLDVLGYLWAQNSTKLNVCAENLTDAVLNMTLGEELGYEVLLGGTTITSRGAPGEYVSRLHTIVSGYELGMPVSGFMASAYVSRMSKSTSSYVYFGGYEGDGNVTKKISLPDDAGVTKAYLEANIGSNFSIFVNGVKVGDFLSYPLNLMAGNWTLCTDSAGCAAYFQSGENIMTINFSKFGNNFVGGGYLKVTYNTSKPDTSGVFSIFNETRMDSYWFPGIKGIINLYSSFYVPGDLLNLTLHAHYKNNIPFNNTGIPVFLYVGSTEIFRSNQSGDVEIDRSDSELRSLLDYGAMSNATTPLRLGMETFRIVSGKGTSDVGLITDRSGSMGDCNVNTNQTPYDCGGCSLTCDDFQSICENACGGSWVPLGGGLYHCTNEAQLCETNYSVCSQCTGAWDAMRYKINVARETDSDFVNAIMNVSGSRIGLASYGYDLCSSDELTYDNQSLAGSIAGYQADCGSTCICCGINKASDMIIKGKYIYPINNSGFTGHSTAGWTESGELNASPNSTTLDQFIFDGGTGMYPDIAHVAGSVYAIAYTGPDSDGWLKTVNISAGGTIIQAAISQYEFDASDGLYPNVIQVGAGAYAVAYTGTGGDGWLKTVRIWDNGTIEQSTMSQYEFDTSDGLYPELIHVSGTVYAIAYTGPGADGWLKTVDISGAGIITASTIDSLEFDTSNGEYPDMIHVDGDAYAIAYDGPSDDGWLKTVSISSAGVISGTTTDSFEFDGNDGNFPAITHVSGDIYAIAYAGYGDDGWMMTVEIGADGNIVNNVIDSYEFDSSLGQQADIMHISGTLYAIVYRGAGNYGWLKMVGIGDEGGISYMPEESFAFQNAAVRFPDLINISDNIYAVAYEYDTGDDGYVKTLRLGDSNFSLYGYWYVSSDFSTSGSIRQNFTLPTGIILNASLTLVHSTSDSLFDGTAYPYCNLTFPGGNATLWSEYWTSADNPAGPVSESVDIIGYLADQFSTYTLECGANVTSGGGRTVVAFDDIMVNLTMKRYRAILVMSDGLANHRCDGYRDYTGTSDDANAESSAINSSCYASENGLEVFSVAFGIDADALTMKRIACWNCSSNSWMEGEGEENCSRYYQSNNAEELREIYKDIAEQMGSATFEAQMVNISGNISLENVLFTDSYLRFNYTPQSVLGYGEVSIALESDRFGGNVTSPKNGTFFIPGNSRVLYSDLLSYSSEFWTSSVQVNSSRTSQPVSVYNISDYGGYLQNTGDPFTVHIPSYLLGPGENNTVFVDTVSGEGAAEGGSPFDKVVYHMGVSGLSGYGEVFIALPNATSDAIQRLQSHLAGFNITMLEITTQSQYISEMPALWGPSVMEIRIWA